MLLLSALLSLTLTAPKHDERLVGTWLAAGVPFITLNANGTGSMDEGHVRWSTDGNTLLVTDADGATDTMTYSVNETTLTVRLGGLPLTLTRASAAGARGSKAEGEALQQTRAVPGPNARPTAPQAQPRESALAQLLLSSAWCSFSYNSVSGASSSTRLQLFRDGTWSTGGRTETFNSGAAGSLAGQYDSSTGGRWEVRNEQLFMSSHQNPVLQPVPGTVTRNSNGSPIITAAGREYSACN